jgi:ketosteroid isomerase-like protein
MKMKREVVPATVQVFSKSSNEVIQTGVQHFYIVEANKEKLVEESKFSRVWKKINDDWKMSSEFDFLVNTKFNNDPASPNSLYNEIAHMDSVLFNAYNAHDVDVMLDFFTKDVEFYHDTGGLISYDNIRDNSKQLFSQNNKIRRDLVSGSLEVYPIKNYGAIEIGSHRFCHDENGKQDCGTFKFVHVWKKENGDWKISRVVSYDH